MIHAGGHRSVLSYNRTVELDAMPIRLYCFLTFSPLITSSTSFASVGGLPPASQKLMCSFSRPAFGTSGLAQCHCSISWLFAGR